MSFGALIGRRAAAIVDRARVPGLPVLRPLQSVRNAPAGPLSAECSTRSSRSPASAVRGGNSLMLIEKRCVYTGSDAARLIASRGMRPSRRG